MFTSTFGAEHNTQTRTLELTVGKEYSAGGWKTKRFVIRVTRRSSRPRCHECPSGRDEKLGEGCYTGNEGDAESRKEEGNKIRTQRNSAPVGLGYITEFAALLIHFVIPLCAAPPCRYAERRAG